MLFKDLCPAASQRINTVPARIPGTIASCARKETPSVPSAFAICYNCTAGYLLGSRLPPGNYPYVFSYLSP